MLLPVGLTSATQLRSVDSGPMMRKGPYTSLARRWLKKEMVCTCAAQRRTRGDSTVAARFISRNHAQSEGCDLSIQLIAPTIELCSAQIV
jgi:hypothetical protein